MWFHLPFHVCPIVSMSSLTIVHLDGASPWLSPSVLSSLWLSEPCICNSYTMAAGVYVSKIPSSHSTSDIYHLERTHLIGERTNENSSHLFYTVAPEDRLWF